MATTWYLLRNDELAVVEEATYGTSAGDPVAGDFFKSETSRIDFAREAETFRRDADRDYGRASVTEMHVGRRKSTFSIKGRVVPSGNAVTPTEPDQDVLYKMGIGSKHKATAHTTTIAGSLGTLLKLAVGGWAASGLADGDMLAVDVSTAAGIEVRQVVSHAGDDVTVDRAFTTDPAAARTVYVGTTYKLSETALLSAHLWLFNGSALRFKVPGSIVNEVAIEINVADGAPTASVTFKGEGQARATQAVAKPTATTTGSVEVPDVSNAWVGTVKVPLVQASLSIKNGLKLRNRQGDALGPTGVNRLDNNSRYLVEQTLEMYLTTGDRDTSVFDSGADTLTARDVIVQLGNAAGKIVAWRTPSYKPNGENTDQDGEIGVKLTGTCYGTTADDEVTLAFI